MSKEKINQQHNLYLKDRENCNITGISEIKQSSEREILIFLNDSKSSILMIRGKYLKITSFNGDQINITGKFDSFTYSD